MVEPISSGEQLCKDNGNDRAILKRPGSTFAGAGLTYK
jgi:hypothetical protein